MDIVRLVDPFTPYGSADMIDDPAPIIGTRDPIEIAKFHRQVSSQMWPALQTFVEHAPLDTFTGSSPRQPR